MGVGWQGSKTSQIVMWTYVERSQHAAWWLARHGAPTAPAINTNRPDSTMPHAGGSR
jgi:hypothetical protein